MVMGAVKGLAKALESVAELDSVLELVLDSVLETLCCRIASRAIGTMGNVLEVGYCPSLDGAITLSGRAPQSLG